MGNVLLITTYAQGAVGAIFRAVKGTPLCVWVVNEHDEDILVIVSQYRLNRMLTNVGINVSTTGAGVDLSSVVRSVLACSNSTFQMSLTGLLQSFLSPAWKKVLAPREEGKDTSIAVFPLWTRKEGFGVISIFKGAVY